MDITGEIRKYICEEVIHNGVSFKNDESLYELGILDSLKMIQLAAFLETKFEISIDPSIMVVEDFETIDNIVSFVKTCKKGR